MYHEVNQPLRKQDFGKIIFPSLCRKILRNHSINATVGTRESCLNNNLNVRGLTNTWRPMLLLVLVADSVCCMYWMYTGCMVFSEPYFSRSTLLYFFFLFEMRSIIFCETPQTTKVISIHNIKRNHQHEIRSVENIFSSVHCMPFH